MENDNSPETGQACDLWQERCKHLSDRRFLAVAELLKAVTADLCATTDRQLSSRIVSAVERAFLAHGAAGRVFLTLLADEPLRAVAVG